jgi:hypothetical protein
VAQLVTEYRYIYGNRNLINILTSAVDCPCYEPHQPSPILTPSFFEISSIRSVHLLVDLPSDGFCGWGFTEMVKQLDHFYPGYCPVACLIMFVLTTKLSAKDR